MNRCSMHKEEKQTMAIVRFFQRFVKQKKKKKKYKEMIISYFNISRIQDIFLIFLHVAIFSFFTHLLAVEEFIHTQTVNIQN